MEVTTLREIESPPAPTCNLTVHLFTDGNGRTAPLLLNDHLLRRGYPHTIIEVETRGEYLAALEEANAGRCEKFAEFVIRNSEPSIGRFPGDQ